MTQQIRGNRHPDTLTSCTNLALTYLDLQRPAQALPLALEALSGRRDLGDDERTLAAVHVLADVQHRLGHDAAVPLAREALEGRRRVLGDMHATTLASINLLAGIYDKRGEPQLGLPLHAECLRAARRTLGNEHPNTLGAMHNLGGAHCERGDYQSGLPLLREAEAGLRKVVGDEHPDTRHVAAAVQRYAGIAERATEESVEDKYSAMLANKALAPAQRSTVAKMMKRRAQRLKQEEDQQEEEPAARRRRVE